MKSLGLATRKIGIGIISFLMMLMCFAISAMAGTISGTVTDGTNGVPARVYVYSNTDQYSYIGSGDTDNNGDYTVADLADGDYKVEFDAYYNYIDKWYNNQDDFNSADTITITASGTTTGINVVLEIGGSISGKMTDANGTGLLGYVEVYTSTDQYPRAGFAYTDDNGDYTVEGLANGDYKVKFTPDGNYLGQWYNNQGDFSSADIVTVTASGTTANIDVVLTAGGGLSGRITDAGGTGISGSVYVYSSTDQYSRVASTHTDATGNYTATGLASGAYKVKFEPDGKSYSQEWCLKKSAMND